MANIEDRFKDANWFGVEMSVIIGGAGGISSWVSLLLSRLQYRIFIVDFDNVEVHNIGTQFFTIDQGRRLQPKVDALRRNCMDFGADGTKVIGMNNRFGKDFNPAGRVMISGFDNMEARKFFFNTWKEYVLNNPDPKEVNMFIDGRMSAETGQIFFVKSKKDIELYETTLFDDSEVEDGPCSFKATPHNGPFIASIITSGLVNQVFNKQTGIDMREIPFMIDFALPAFEIRSLTRQEYEKE